MTLISAASAPKFQLPGTLFTGLASPARGSSENAVWHTRSEPGSTGAVHQLTREEVFVCIAGEGEARIGAASFRLTQGDALIVPADTDFSLSNPGQVPFEAIVVFPVGGQAVRPGHAPFTPPWAE
ncbi:cupin domain-containing protein [Devosia lacusdianchii]|uniref:cupin domain-containing protein n=1 Tax=Devosia lacusdianchii TaxID=2917991 RepID=UPI001F052C4D|nr:cupin domain-containing protein [Devosia sp. JXJ CY 41]